jgi:hypothetical protein
MLDFRLVRESACPSLRRQEAAVVICIPCDCQAGQAALVSAIAQYKWLVIAERRVVGRLDDGLAERVGLPPGPAGGMRPDCDWPLTLSTGGYEGDPAGMRIIGTAANRQAPARQGVWARTPAAVYIDVGAKRTVNCARERWAGAMQSARQDVVDMLRRTGLPELAEEALRVLPDPVDLDFAAKVLQSYGVTRDELIDRMGGSP